MTDAKAPASLAEALAALQANMPAVGKDHTASVTSQRTGGTYKYEYAAGEDITARLYPVMAPLGLSFTACPTMTPDHGFVLAYRLLHASADMLEGVYPLPDPAKLGPQDLGKAITYARRYALCALVGLFPGGEDTDATTGGQAITEPARKPRNVPDSQLASEGRMTRQQLRDHERLEKDVRGRKPGERAQRARPSEPDPGDPGAQDAPVDHDRARRLRETIPTDPEDRPGSIMPGQQRAIEMMLGMLGFKREERADRHAHASLRLGIERLESMSDLSAAQAARLIRALQDDLDDLKKAETADA